MEEILDVIAESRAAIEVNGDPFRLDMPPEWLRSARVREISAFAISVDAHSTRGMQNLKFGVQMARRGGLRQSEVLNTLSAERVRSCRETGSLKASDASLRSGAVVAMFTGQLALFGNASAAGMDEEISSIGTHHARARSMAGAASRLGARSSDRLRSPRRAPVVWRSETRVMYDRTVEVPRQYAMLGDGHRDAGHPIVSTMRHALDRRYGTRFERVSAALYRDGRDSVAFHGDYVARRMPEALVATVSVGAPRKFLLRRQGAAARHPSCWIR